MLGHNISCTSKAVTKRQNLGCTALQTYVQCSANLAGCAAGVNHSTHKTSSNLLEQCSPGVWHQCDPTHDASFWQSMRKHRHNRNQKMKLNDLRIVFSPLGHDYVGVCAYFCQKLASCVGSHWGSIPGEHCSARYSAHATIHIVSASSLQHQTPPLRQVVLLSSCSSVGVFFAHAKLTPRPQKQLDN